MKKTNKKGFTLIELLAVIIILAVLMLLAVPQVLKLQTKAKQNAFRSQVEMIYKAAQQQASADSLNTITCFAKNTQTANPSVSPSTADTLSLQGTKKVVYKVTLDSDKNITGIWVYTFDGNMYLYLGSDKAGDISNIEAAEIDSSKTSIPTTITACS